jgi:hypothetical protein
MTPPSPLCLGCVPGFFAESPGFLPGIGSGRRVFRVPFGDLRRFRGVNGCLPYCFSFCVSRGV